MVEKSAHKALAFLRIGAGIVLVLWALPNLDATFLENLPNQLNLAAHNSPIPLFQWIMAHWVIPHTKTFGPYIPVGQLLVGCALIIGFFTPIVSIVGVAYALILLFASGHLELARLETGLYMALIFAALWFADAGQYYGLDGILFKKGSSGGGGKAKLKNKKHQAVVEALNESIKKSRGKSKKFREPAEY